MKVLKFIDEQFEKWFLIVSLIVMVLVTFMQIVLRWFNAATVWAEEFSRYVMLYQVWVGASYAIGGALMTIRLVQKIVERLRNTQEEEA